MIRKTKKAQVATLAKPMPLTRRTADILLGEGRAWYHVLRYEWLSALSIIIGVVALIFFWEPLPPNEIGLAVGREGTSDGIYGEKLVAFFAEHGIKLNLTYTEGGKQPVDAMVREKSIQSALVLGGLYNKRELSNVYSLGSAQYEALWVFYRGEDFAGDHPIIHFSNKKISIGEPGSGSYSIISPLLATQDLTKEPSQGSVYNWSSGKSFQALLDGELDAFATVDGIDSPMIQKLIATPSIKIASFGLAPAYVKKLSHLEIVSIPRGSFTVFPIYPEKDIQMVATTLTLVVEKTLHSAIQLLFLMAMDHLGDSRDQFFAKPDEFPSYKDSSIELAPNAKVFFSQGRPSSLKYLPFWASSIFEQLGFLLLSCLAVVYPLYRLFPNYRVTLTSDKVALAFEVLHKIQAQFRQAQTQEEFDQIMRDFKEIQGQVEDWIPSFSIPAYYGLLGPIDRIKRIAAERQDFLNQ